MATLTELAKANTVLDDGAIEHLVRLVGSWGMLADLCFADLLLLAPAKDGDQSFIVLGQMRPSTTQTLHRVDLVGQVLDEVERPLIPRAWRSGEIFEGEFTVPSTGERARVQCIPVRWRGRMIAVMTREAPFSVGRRPGELERVYVETFDRFARMIVNGEFPFADEEAETEESPRVGDGVLLVDKSGRVDYASPNAVNALHRMGIYSNIQGMRLDEIGIEESAVQRALSSATPFTEEIERRNDVIVLLHCIPIIDNFDVSGGLVLLRDVTALRRRDRLLLSKDATIREVHHRVKNNLQTISSLLRLQARRVGPGAGQTALREAERRIRSIALVHDILSRDAVDQVEFSEIVADLIRMAEDGVVSLDRKVHFTRSGDAGELPASVATPLAVVLNELLQNAGEHAFPEDAEIDGDATVEMQLRNDGQRLMVRVCDTGVGLPEGFAIDKTESLGLSIVRDLVSSQLSGTIDMHTDNGTVIELVIPLRSDIRADK